MACRRQLFPFPPSGSSVFPAAGLQPVLIFLLGGQSAADVALRLVDVQHHPGLGRQGGIDVGEAVGDVFMYCTLRYIPSWVFPWERFVHHMYPVELL